MVIVALILFMEIPFIYYMRKYEEYYMIKHAVSVANFEGTDIFFIW